jgi:plasmid stabilization system protein ParE
MRFRLTLRPEAYEEFREGIAWYAHQKKGLGKRFAAAVHEVLKRLRRMPRIHGFAVDDVRRAIVTGFPYVEYYRVEGKDVIVIAIFYSKRDPAEWQARM